MRTQGVSGVCRYLDGGRVPSKGLTREETEDIAAAGVRIHTVYETSGGADIEGFPQDGDYFNEDQGRLDWLEAIVDARRAGQPAGYPIYLAVDRHMPSEEWDIAPDGSTAPRLRAYFHGALRANRDIGISGYSIGVYGPDYVCAFIRESLGIWRLWPWLPRPPAEPDFRYDLWQYENGATVCGVAVDRNECRYEGWVPGGGDMDQVAFDAMALDWWRRSSDHGGAGGLETVIAHADAINKLITGEVIDDAERAELKARLDKLRSI